MNENELALKQRKKAFELLDALIDEGYEYFTLSTSRSKMGVSTYVQDIFHDIKYRISDHSVTNYNRVFEEKHFDFDTPIEELVLYAKEKFRKIEERLSAIEKQEAREEKRKTNALEKWERIKKYYPNLVWKKIDRTYQDFDTFSSRGENERLHIYQTVIGSNRDGQVAYSYEWAERTDYDKWGYSTNYGNEKPSIDYIEIMTEE